MNAKPDAGDDRFKTTRWTQVYASVGNSSEAHEAMRQLCESYYKPVAAFIRQTCRNVSDADDLTQEFFSRILSGNPWDRVDRQQGRFRSYLLGAVKHFLSDTEDRRLAEKRGGGRLIQSLHTALDSEGDRTDLGITDPQGFPPDAFFDRQWALNLLNQVLQALEQEYATAGRTVHYATLRDALTGTLVSDQVAASLGISANALKVAVHRLRKRFRDLFKQTLLQTLDDPVELSQEMDYLLTALNQRGQE